MGTVVDRIRIHYIVMGRDHHLRLLRSTISSWDLWDLRNQVLWTPIANQIIEVSSASASAPAFASAPNYRQEEEESVS
ncbi:hypothetical protein FHL15_001653 [Xylaria flabelliformis]|uniref:Uncharacterized protein n=1 Tax=Xylaria flabelliformis TaxID=2512241 RepID=A0A553IB08_9PEZI|nr:hypothetical protein FHL15_001653 [Xylaria flabelliformis]